MSELPYVLLFALMLGLLLLCCAQPAAAPIPAPTVTPMPPAGTPCQVIRPSHFSLHPWGEDHYAALLPGEMLTFTGLTNTSYWNVGVVRERIRYYGWVSPLALQCVTR